MTTTEGKEKQASLFILRSMERKRGWKRGCPEIDVYPDEGDESGEKSERKERKGWHQKKGMECWGGEDNEREFFHPLFVAAVI